MYKVGRIKKITAIKENVINEMGFNTYDHLNQIYKYFK